MNDPTFIRFFIGLAIFYCFMIGRFAYFAYVKAPREITRLQSESNKAEVKKWRDYRDRCKINIALFLAGGVLCLVFFVAGV